MKQKLSLTVVYLIRYVATGIMWIAHGILRVAAAANSDFVAASRVCMIIAFVATFVSFVIRQENEDDVTRMDFYKACTFTLMMVGFAAMILAIISDFASGTELDFNLFYPFVIGGGLLLIGISFLVIEGKE